MKKLKLKNNIYIGKDSLGPLIRVDLYKEDNNYKFKVTNLRDENDKNLKMLKDNLEIIIDI